MGEWAIQEFARAAGTTSRTLRYYGEIGLLPATRVGANGYRYYDEQALVRLQRILLLRELGMGLSAIGEVLDGQEPVPALHDHLQLLQQEGDRIERQIASVRCTVRKLERGEELMAQETLDGFDHTRYEDEVVRRWGRPAYASADRWWRSLSDAEKREFQQQGRDIAGGFQEAFAAGEAADGAQAQELAHRQYEWVSTGWGGRRPCREAFAGLGQLYVDDPRYGMGNHECAAFIRAAMSRYAERNL